MSIFAVEKRKIASVIPHPNADTLSICTVEGLTFQFICKNGTQEIGNLVAYFPVDSVLKPDLIEHFGIGNMLAGADHNRIKTVRLRGSYGQGFVSNVSSIFEFLTKNGQNFTTETLPDDLTTLLQVEKYEPPAVLEKNARLIPLSGRIEVYDIEGSQRFPHIIEYMMDKKVGLSEKIEGMNGGFSVFENGDIKANQKNFFIEPKDGEEHTFWTLAKKYKLEENAKHLQETIFSGKSLTWRFEVIGEGIQGNIYKIKGHDIRMFDINVNDSYLNVKDFLKICENFNIPTVPILAVDITLREWLAGKTFEEASNGLSVLAPIKREGIVCKLMEEETIQDYGRSIIKNRSAEYLSKSEF